MSRYADLPFVQARNYGGARSQTQMIVIHCTANTASAANEAAYAKTRTDGVSAHFYADGTQVIQALDTAVVAFGCFPTGNSRSVQFELTGLLNAVSDATMRRVAPVVARACAEFGIPIRKVNPAQLVAGAKGICGHGDVTRAWGEGDHLDPGDNFPWATFINYVAAAAGGEDNMADLNMAQVVKTWTEGGRTYTRTLQTWMDEMHAGTWSPINDAQTGIAPRVARIETALAGLATAIAALTAKVDALSTGGVDEESLATAVADKLAARLRE